MEGGMWLHGTVVWLAAFLITASVTQGDFRVIMHNKDYECVS